VPAEKCDNHDSVLAEDTSADKPSTADPFTAEVLANTDINPDIESPADISDEDSASSRTPAPVAVPVTASVCSGDPNGAVSVGTCRSDYIQCENVRML